MFRMRSPRLLPRHEKGTPAALPTKPEQIPGRPVPTPGTHREHIGKEHTT